jgi:hypothetical protein
MLERKEKTIDLRKMKASPGTDKHTPTALKEMPPRFAC